MKIRGDGMPIDGSIEITGADPVFSTRFKVGETCAAVLAGVGVAVSDLWEMKTGKRQRATIDVRGAAAAVRSKNYLQMPGLDGDFAPVRNANFDTMISVTQPWPTRDGRWFLPHFGLPNLQKRVLDVLGCEFNPESVARAVAKWDALDLEAAIDEARACGAMVRSNAEWLDHPHGQVLTTKPIVEIIKIADSDPEPMPQGERPLSGIRVLDLTRILAGPIAARTLAEHGADVLMVTKDGLPQIREHVIDTSHGKRSCYLNLKEAEDVARLKDLVRGADVFSEGYRPGVMSKLGFGASDLAKMRPGIICLSISCFGNEGPFSHRAGWEQVAQTVTGICHEGSVERPVLLPAPACDYTTGYLGAYGILLALGRRAREGGSYQVRVSLCQSAMFIYRQGQTRAIKPEMDLSKSELETLCIETDTVHGRLKHLAPVLKLSQTQPYWSRPTPELGGDKPEWLV